MAFPFSVRRHRGTLTIHHSSFRFHRAVPLPTMQTDSTSSTTNVTPDPVRFSGSRASRREFLRLLGLGFLASYTVATADASDDRSSAFRIQSVDEDGTTFPQSVASGDPTPSGVIFWTRLAPAAVTGTDHLVLELALDAGFTRNVLRVRVPADQITAALDYTLRLDLDGRLEPNTLYYYHFIYRQVSSRTAARGPCRTNTMRPSTRSSSPWSTARIIPTATTARTNSSRRTLPSTSCCTSATSFTKRPATPRSRARRTGPSPCPAAARWH